MSISGNLLRKILSIVLVIAILLTTVGCSGSPPNPVLSDPNGETLVENTQTEHIITETVFTEFITEEVYLEEFVLVENQIAELLLEENTIDEVILCKTIFVPQDNIEEFAANSQTAQLFGADVDITSLLTKVAIGSGVIVTVVILKKVGLPDPVASIVTAAADEAVKFAGAGAAGGSLFGGLTGATNAIDETGRTSAVIGFATATVGLILSAVGLVAAIPSGGSSGVSVAAGIKLVIAGVSVLAGTAGTVTAGYNAVKTFQATDAANIDWENIDWQKVGASSAQKAIENAADGYMWGSIIGVVYGGAEGYEYFHKYHTPYTNYQKRIKHLEQMKTKGLGEWTGIEGESEFILKEPVIYNGTKITKVSYKNGIPDFSPYAIAEVEIPKMTDKRLGPGGNYEQANTALAELWTKKQHMGRSWTARQVEEYRITNNLTWHEMSNMESMQLVPFDVNNTFKHYGGVAEYNAMLKVEGGADFD
mgnify:CR=1 FL=1